MNERQRQILIEQTTTAWRPRDVDGGVRWHPVFYDLTTDDRRRAFDQTSVQRNLEAALDPDGLSSTAHAVMARIRSA